MLLCLALLGAGLQAADGEFRPKLLEVRLDHGAVPAGSRLAVTWVWQNTGSAADAGDQRVFVHVRRAGEDETAPDGVRLGGDHMPGVPTRRWTAGRVVRYGSAIDLPRNMPPGEYLLLFGLYDVDSGQRRAVDGPPDHDGSKRYLAARFTVLPAGAAAGAQLVNTISPVPPPAAAPPAPRPARTAQVGTGDLVLTVDAEQPRLVSWRLAGHELAGDPELLAPTVRVIDVGSGRPRIAEKVVWTARPGQSAYTWHGAVSCAGQPAVEFDLTCTVERRAAVLELAKVVERPGWELASVGLDRVVACGPDGRLALPWNAGRLVDPSRSDAAERVLGMDWVTQALAGVVHGGPLAASLRVPAVDDQLVASTDPGWGALGAILQWRAPARPPVPSLRLTSRPRVVLHFDAVNGRAADWTDGARLLRADVTAKPPPAYRDAVIYKIFCDSPGSGNYTSFAQAADLVRRVSALTDGGPQVAYLVGWQHQGHDTGYPDVFTVNERLGGMAGLRAAIADAAAHNAVLSFHDNYDDAYQTSPAWEPTLIAREVNGELQKGGVWAGGQSYLMSFGPTAAKRAVARVERTLATYPIRSSYHIDVLSAVPRRLDFNAGQPSGGELSLAGKVAIVRAFNQHGVDVTSEGFCDPFVGVLGHTWHLMRGREPLFTAEERIPFTPFVYHGHATWGGGIGGDPALLDALILGATFSADFTRGTPLEQILDATYLVHQPFRLLRLREASGYRAEGTTRRMDYGRDSFVEVDDAANRYQVVVDGRLVARDYAVFVPSAGSQGYLAYARSAGRLTWPAPPGCRDGQVLEAVELTAEGPGAKSTVTVQRGQVELELKARVPVLVRTAGK
ncbi:MAG: hypothetical protein HZB16_18380 [Armatimonadetes bacterium]|nr:hypothetical protein [Armatimonadota bacterium]